MKKNLPFLLFGLAVLSLFSVFAIRQTLNENSVGVQLEPSPQVSGLASLLPTTAVSPSPTLLPSIPSQTDIALPVHYFQTFNNCGPATLAMVVNYYGIDLTQQQLGNQLRPYQNAAGDNDDKSVSLEEMADKAEELGLVAYHRPAGDIELLKQLVSNDLPVITRTWTGVNEDIGHFRVVTGYDEQRQVIIQDDSLQGKDIAIPYADFLTMWEKFNYEYLLAVEPDQRQVAETILGEKLKEGYAWSQAAEFAQQQLEQNPNDIYARFNLAVALYHLGDFQGTIDNFEQVESQLPPRTLWYQLEPLLAYQQLGKHDILFAKIDQILNSGNRAYSELYLIRGQVYQQRGDIEAAREQYQLAVEYNQNLEAARQALATVQ